MSSGKERERELERERGRERERERETRDKLIYIPQRQTGRRRGALSDSSYEIAEGGKNDGLKMERHGSRT
jgi:hypothetical protein